MGWCYGIRGGRLARRAVVVLTGHLLSMPTRSCVLETENAIRANRNASDIVLSIQTFRTE